MNNCVVNFKQPENEPIKKYLQGSEERIKLEAEMQRQLSEKIEIPLIIDGKEIFTENRKPIICPHNHKTILGYYCQAGEKELKMAIESAMNARKVWQNFQWEDRTAIYLKAADLITKKYTY
ncbi:MAG: aldehyde dehydrogenase family protein, partial [Candidatus Cloacimonetes bacterium]|nr:aldehyde dehydrogenase family protein [Candidatus Cloacimonadota bacterium]